MAKRRIKNNFQKWAVKSVPFFLIVFFVFFNVSFFVFNSSTYESKMKIGLSGSMKKISHESSFDYVLSIHEREELKDMIEMYKIERDDYPPSLAAVLPTSKNKNWIYTKSADRYILEYKR